MTRRAALALAALAAILAITAAWWTLALWPASSTVPAWVERTRAVCFGVAPGGLPSGAGWLSLVGEPVGMLGFLLIVWGEAVREGLGALRRARAGRLVLAAGAAGLLVAATAAARRIHQGGERFDASAPAPPGRVDQPAPPLVLVDQHGDTVDVARLVGRPVVVAFAYGHCEAVCPAIVRDAVRAVRAVPASRPALLVVTLDPWRDTPSRLPHLAHAWALPAGAHVLGGSVERVTRVLDDWRVARTRDGSTGEIVHQTSVYLLDRRGRIAYVATPDGARTLETLLRAL